MSDARWLAFSKTKDTLAEMTEVLRGVSLSPQVRTIMSSFFFPSLRRFDL